MTTIEWNNVETINNRIYNSVVYSNKNNKFTALGSNSNSSVLYIANSIDGTNWTDVYNQSYNQSINSDVLGNIFYVEEKDLYLAFIPNKNNPLNDTDVIKSDDGISWIYQSTIQDYTSTSSDLTAFIFNKKLVYDSTRNVFITTLNTVNNTNNLLFRSTDGINWESIDIAKLLNININITCMTYINNTIICSSLDYINLGGYIIISKDGGNTWSINFKTDAGLTQIISSNKIITCFSVGKTGVSTIFTSSPSKLSWKSEFLPVNNYLIYQSLYANGMYTVIAQVENTNNITYGTSYDGINWLFNNLLSAKNKFVIGLSYSYFINSYIIFVSSTKGTNVLLGVPRIEPICLPAETPIVTDQGVVHIDKLDISTHTIDRKPIVAITQTITPEKELVCFEKNSLGINCPTRRTIMTSGHEVLYKGKLVQAKYFVGNIDGVHTIPYDGKVLYNVLHNTHGLMKVNNMVLETLNPKNRIAASILNGTL